MFIPSYKEFNPAGKESSGGIVFAHFVINLNDSDNNSVVEMFNTCFHVSAREYNMFLICFRDDIDLYDYRNTEIMYVYVTLDFENGNHIYDKSNILRDNVMDEINDMVLQGLGLSRYNIKD